MSLIAIADPGSIKLTREIAQLLVDANESRTAKILTAGESHDHGSRGLSPGDTVKRGNTPQSWPTLGRR